MKNTLRSMRAKRAAGDSGFTLIELLVVVVIIGVLVAIAIPVYMDYREGAADKAAQSDIRSAITAVEAHYTDNSSNYPTANATGASGAVVTLGTLKLNVSDGTVLGYRNLTGTDAGPYRLCAKNDGGETVYVYNSADGGSVKEAAQTSVTACLAA